MKRFAIRMCPFLGLGLCCAYMISEGQLALALFTLLAGLCIELAHL